MVALGVWNAVLMMDACSEPVNFAAINSSNLCSVQFTMTITLPPYISEDEHLPMDVYYMVYTDDGRCDI